MLQAEFRAVPMARTVLACPHPALGPPLAPAGPSRTVTVMDLIEPDLVGPPPRSFLVYDGPLGPMTLTATDAGLCSLQFSDSDAGLPDPRAAAPSSPAHEHLFAVRRALDAYFAGRPHAFDVPYTLAASPFTTATLAACASVPFGSTITYGELAARLGSPRASRAVGSALATNPLLIVIPCHRVVPADGTIGGYAAGTPAKEWLLDLEAA